MPKAKRKAFSKRKSASKDKTTAAGTAAAGPESKPIRKSKPKKKRNPKDYPKLDIKVEIAKTARKPIFFFWTDSESEGGFLSPWYPCPFEFEGIKYVSVGHYIMVRRAEMFEDEESREKILLATTEDEIKALGDNIKDSPIAEWAKHRDYTTHIKIGNQRKFLYSDQSDDLLNRLAELGDRELVFADPTDPYLGVGLDASEAEALGRKSWGRNAFGKSYYALRKKIRNPVSPVKRELMWYDMVW